MLIYLMRHGETDWNVQFRLQGSTDVPLNENGRAEARQTAKALGRIPFDMVYTSPLSRARETAEIIAEGRNIPVLPKEDLKEMNFGIYEGHSSRTWPEIKAIFDDPVGYVPKGGESYQQMDERCRSFLTMLAAQEGTYEHVLVCAHGALLKGMIRIVENRPLERFWDGPPQKNCAVTLVECKNGQFTLLEQGKVYTSFVPAEKTWKSLPEPRQLDDGNK